ncbi:MAG TPA: carboxypeptidase-like regulatory domain-containing protein [Terriglobia bacterium]|nr:carboxypeptidase-like regulatory domain-containing protein [Terriglobia bacterium]
MNLLRLCAMLLLGVAQIAPGKSVTGTVRLAGGGAPASGVRVVAIPVNEPSALVSLSQTDQQGRYVLEDIPPGRYFIAAGPVAFLTFYPGTSEQNAARAIDITNDSTVISRIDFTLSSAPLGMVPGNALLGSGPSCCRFQGQVVTEDGSPLPAMPFQIVNRSGAGVAANYIYPEARFYISLPLGTQAYLVMDGLPPGYFLKSAPYGSQDMALGPVLVDGKSPATLKLTVGYRALSTLQPTIASGNINSLPPELKAASFSLTSTMPGGPTVVAALQPDRSFVFPSIPVGAYRAGIVSPAGHASVSSILVVIRDTVSNLKIDFGDDPFPEMGGVYPSPSPFVDGKEITQKLVGNKPAYFRMNVTDANGAVTPWAIYTPNSSFVPRIVPGETYTVTGTVARDGTNRLNANPF